MEKAEKAKALKQWKRKVEMGGAFELADSINEYARRRNSALPQLG